MTEITSVTFNDDGVAMGARWFGPKDAVGIGEWIANPAVTHIISALHADVVTPGEIWTEEAIAQRKIEIEFYPSADAPAEAKGLELYRWYFENGKRTGLIWSTVESLPFIEQVKNGSPDRDGWIDKFNISQRNLAKFGATEFGVMGVKTIVGNFMLMADWTRTGYAELSNGAKSLTYHHPTFAAFDIFILKRHADLADDAGLEQIQAYNVPEAELQEYIDDGSYTAEELAEAKQVWEKELKENPQRKDELTRMIIAGLPGAQEGFTLSDFRKGVLEYKGKTVEWLRENIKYFLERVVPVAKECGLNLSCHPDDPAYSPFMGTPRAVGSAAGYKFLLDNGMGVNLCPGSLMADPQNRDIMRVIFELAEHGKTLGMTIEQIFPHVHFRPITTDGRSFTEGFHAEHVEEEAKIAYALAELEWKGVLRPDHAPTLSHGAGDRGYHGVGRGYGANLFLGLISMARDLVAAREPMVQAVLRAAKSHEVATETEALAAAREAQIKFMMDKVARHKLSPALEGKPNGEVVRPYIETARAS